MKVFFDSNVYIAEALLGSTAERMVASTRHAQWRIFVSAYVLEEVARVMMSKFSASRRFASLSRRRILRRARLVKPAVSRHAVPLDPADSPILRAAIEASVDYLVTNDAHLLALDPYESVRIVSMGAYCQILVDYGLFR